MITIMQDPKQDRSNLEIPLQFFPGIGPDRAVMLERLGIRRPIDLLFFFPRGYQDVVEVRSASELVADVRSSVQGLIEAIDFRQYEDGRSALGVLLDTGKGFVRCVWYNQPYRKEVLARGMRLVATGIPKPTGVSWEIRHPEIQILQADTEMTKAVPLPIYPLTEGLQQRNMQKIVDKALEKLLQSVNEVLPESFRTQHGLLDIQTALKQIHQPENMNQAEEARYRFIFQELFIYQLAIAIRREQIRNHLPAPSIPPSALIDSRIMKRFPFELTGDQRQAISEVGADMARTIAMNRLVQGDVGSGKTVIALYAMLLSVARGYQSALMVPTEILARQHAGRLRESLSGSEVQVELLAGSVAQRDRTEIMERIAIGTADIVVGTQALLSDQVAFAKLGLVVIDEQHKFGVQQRAALRGSQTQPHYLVLSATPIPRTLTMTALGDLDVSILREKPAGRSHVHTYLGQPTQTDSWWEFVGKQIRKGRQAYVITARVEQESDEDLKGAMKAYEDLRQGALKEFSIGLLHGRMDGETKQKVLDDFNSGEIDVLVATTVVEVGIDVPNATVMTIFDADRMGLAQLHQLRGRISRGTHPGYLCAFASGGISPLDNDRLKALAETEDGFELAERDLQLRGPGDLLGLRQHGLPPFRIADLVRDVGIVREARTLAMELIQKDPGLASQDWAQVKRQVLGKHGDMLSLGDVG